MISIFKREFRAYFTSPLGYVFIAICFLTSGFFFYATSLVAGSTDVSGVFESMYIVYMFTLPILCMRLMADDKKQKTDQLLLTSPVNLFGLVLGKFLAAFAVFLISTLIMLVYAVVIAQFTAINWSIIFGYWLGIVLIGGIYTALGLLISSLTENQMIAAIIGIILNFLLFMMDSLASVIPFKVMQKALSAISIHNRFTEFTMGFFNISNILFFCSLIFVFLFLSVRVVERRRWA